ncbi:Tat-binding 7 [Fulvia fulva]|uniref:Tat-binding 7 n=1 Tax=Passalora fulva TaxID=5499 RepID=A0A9Q8L6U2_PASFU|nr:Tat-binding 7 [Fulvia fulva]KAK4637216.1 Tat-binding 7 [Fulvia fulva]UJO11846.1 Tat-binding 7 [Fulvia fulva]WPV08978.1 Tat-binding 7 [Fulvia fulva]
MAKRERPFDPNRSDSDDLDFNDEPSSPRARPHKRARKSHKGSPTKRPAKRRREAYNDSDIDPDSNEPSEEEDSFAESDEDSEPVETNPRTGRGVRSAAKKRKNYEESDEEAGELLNSESEVDRHTPARPKGKRSARAERLQKRTLVVKLKVPPFTMVKDKVVPRSTRASSRQLKREPTPQATRSAPGMTRRSSRLSHDEEQPLVALTDSGKHELVTRTGTVTPEPEGSRRPSRGGKGLASKKPPSAIFEVSQEDSVANDPVGTIEQTEEGEKFFSQLQDAAGGQDAQQVSRTSPATSAVKEDDIRMEYEEEDEEEQVVQESQHDPDDNDDDDEPVSKGGRSLRPRRKASTPPTSQPANNNARRSLRNRKSGGIEQSSDFEPDAEGEADVEEEGMSDSDELLKPPRGRSSAEASSQGGRRSGRLRGKTTSNGSRSRRSPEEDELDPEEIADEAAELDEDNRRIRRERPRKQRSQRQEISFEPTSLRNRANRPDYRILRPELLLPIEDDDAPAVATTTPQRNRRGGGGGGRAGAQYRSLFSTFGPFGGAGGPPPILGGPDGAGATGGVDSDSSDDEAAMRGQQSGVGGTVGMTPTSAFPKPFVAQAHNSDPIQGPGGGPPGLGKVKDKKALADADPLGVDTNVTFDGVGGLDGHINQLKEMVMLPLLYPEAFQQFKITPPRGVLFHGPPGTGKTLLARALASSVSTHGQKVTFYMRKGADALSKWVGEAEKQLRLLFEEARKNQPSIIFFDEIDGLAPVRSSKQEQIHASIVATLLALMDGMDGRGQVIVIGATNRPDSVDPALRRPGRFDREFYFPLPDVMGRRKILDIHTKGWEPPLKDEFKDQLAEVTRGYGGADLRALCTEAALNAIQGTFPQIYSSDEKLIIDVTKIKVLAKDFMISVNKIVPSSERSAASGAVPLKKDIEPLLRQPLKEIGEYIEQTVPRKRKATALEEAMYDDRDDELGFEKETMHRNFESSRVFRPRLLIKGHVGMGQQYLGAALLTKFEGLHVQNFDMATLMKDSSRSPEAAVVQLFEEVKRHKPSVIYIPNVNIWWDTLADSVKRTFVGLLRSLPPNDPVLLLGMMELYQDDEPDPHMLRDLFGFASKNQYKLDRPCEEARGEFWRAILDFVKKTPSEFPEPENRKKRKLAELPVAPVPAAPTGPTKADLKAQKKKDHQTLNMLKLLIQPVMDQIKLKYRKFRNHIIDENTIGYLYDEQDPMVLSTDLTEEQKQQQLLFRPFEKDTDDKGNEGLREQSTGKFYYNLEIVTIETRLSNGYYKRPKDFLGDIKKLAKDAKTSGDQERTLKANEMLANVEVDMTTLESQHPALIAECEAVYHREQERIQKAEQKRAEAQGRGETVPKIIANVPPQGTSNTTTETSGPVMLGQAVPGRQLFPTTPNKPQYPPSVQWSTTQTNGSHPSQHTNGSTVPSKPQEDSEMLDSHVETQEHQPAQTAPPQRGQAQSPDQSQSQPQGAYYHKIGQSQPAAGVQTEQNSASTASGNKTSDRSSGGSVNTTNSNGAIMHPDFSIYGAAGGSSQLPDTQPPSLASQPGAGSQHNSNSSGGSQPSASSQQMGPPQPRPATRPPSFANISNILNKDDDDEEEGTTHDDIDESILRASQKYILDAESLERFHGELVEKSSGLSLEQLEQVNAALMDVIWRQRGEWNRDLVWHEVQQCFNDTIRDIEELQEIMDPKSLATA